MTLRMIDTFSGIGGFSLAARWMGEIETVQFVRCYDLGNDSAGHGPPSLPPYSPGTGRFIT